MSMFRPYMFGYTTRSLLLPICLPPHSHTKEDVQNTFEVTCYQEFLPRAASRLLKSEHLIFQEVLFEGNERGWREEWSVGGWIHSLTVAVNRLPTVFQAGCAIRFRIRTRL